MPNDDAPDRWRHNDIDLLAGNRTQLLCQPPAQALGISGIRENLGALQILTTMQPAGKAEVSAQIGACLIEQIHDRRVHQPKDNNDAEEVDARCCELARRVPETNIGRSDLFAGAAR